MPTDSSGFFEIALPPSILAKCEKDLRDLRIRDNRNTDVPFIVKKQKGKETSALSLLPIIGNRTMEDKKTHIRIKTENRKIEQLVLEVQNSSATRSVSVNGGNDSRNWFAIKDNLVISTNKNDTSGSFFFTIDLPVTTFPFLEIIFNDKDVLPVNILNAFISTNGKILPAYDTIYAESISAKDSLGTTLLTAVWQDAYPFERINFDIQKPQFYRREVMVLKPEKRDNEIFTIQSGSPNWIPIASKSTSIEFELKNDDNPPLSINAVEGLIARTNIYAWFEANNTYTLYFGDSLAETPTYDLVYFKDLIPDNTPNAVLGNIEKNAFSTSITANKVDDHTSLWMILAGILIILLFVTYKLVGEIKK